MNKIVIKKLLLASLIALELNNSFTRADISKVYAQEESYEDNLIYLNENGKKLLLIAITYGDYKEVTLGYKFPKDNAIWFKDALSNRTYNMNRITDFMKYPELVYEEIENILPDELKNRDYLTREEALNIIASYRVVDAVTKLPNANDVYHDYVYQTFESIETGENVPHIANSSLFTDPYDTFNRFSLDDNYNEDKEIIDSPLDDYKLGICEYLGVYECYKDIYSEEFKRDYKGGIITRFYVFDENGNYLKSLYTQKQVDEFILEHKEKVNSYIWKAALYQADNMDEILIDISNNKIIPSKHITYFISYNPKPKNLTIK